MYPAPVQVEQRYVWLLYRFWDRDGNLLYVGITRQDAIERWIQHIRNQPWAYMIRRMEADPVEFSSEAEVRVAERDAIHAELPYCNKEHNYGNPNRWVFDEHPVRVQRRGGRPATARVPLAPVRRRVPDWARWPLAIAAVWLAGTLGLWWAVEPAVAGVHGLEYGATVMSIIEGVGMWKFWPKRRRRRRYR